MKSLIVSPKIADILINGFSKKEEKDLIVKNIKFKDKAKIDYKYLQLERSKLEVKSNWNR